MRVLRRATSRGLLGLLLALACAGMTHAQTTLNFTGAAQTYTLPAGASGVLITALGAGGGGGGSDQNGPGSAAGAGAAVSGVYLVAGGTTLDVYVGGGGAQGYTSAFGRDCTNSFGAGGSSGGAGGFGGGTGGAAGCSGWSGAGGGGGGATVVATSANVPLLIAGGGGGGQGGSWNSTAVPSQSAVQIGELPGSAGQAGSSYVPTNDGGGGGGGGGGCPGGAGGSTHEDNTGTSYGYAEISGASCAASSVTNFSLLSTPGGAGGAGQVASDGATNPGGVAGSPGSATFVPLYAVTVTVFADTGAGGGVANDGIQNGTEAGLANAAVTATAGGVTVATATTNAAGRATLLLPYTSKGASVTLTAVVQSGEVATGGSAGTTGGSYTRSGVTFTFGANQAYTGVAFGFIPPNSLATHGAQSTVPGGVVFYTHTFTAGSAGQVAFATSAVASPTLGGWREEIYLDSACSGVWTAADGLITAPIALSAGQGVCVLVKEFAPATAAANAADLVTLTATFTYSGTAAPASSALTQTDATTVSGSGNLELTKRVQNVSTAGAYGTSDSASPGQTLQYQLNVVNQGGAALSTLVIDDATPAFTTFVAAACPTVASLPAGLTSCTVTAQPTVGGSGAIQWTFGGTLAPGGSTAVTFQVIVTP